MRLYRICHVDHLESYQGLGVSYRHGGRWNEPGIPVGCGSSSSATRRVSASGMARVT